MRYLLMIASLLVSLPAAAQVNKCQVGDKVVYQAAPCKAGATRATLAPRNDVSEDSARANREKFIADDKVRQAGNRRERIDGTIAALERDIAGYQKSMDAELATLQARKASANNNLAGATWEQSLSTEMQAVTAKYQTKIKTAQDRIAGLRQERATLDK